MIKQEIVQKAYQIPGWAWPTELGILWDELSASKSHLEVGTFCGKSLLVSACAMPPESRLVWVDPLISWGNMVSADWIHSVLHATLAEIDSLTQRSVEGHRTTFLAYANGCNTKFHTIYLDADHHYAETKAAIQIAQSLLEPDGVIYGHDYWSVDLGVMDAVQEMCPRFHVFPNTRIWRYQPCVDGKRETY